MKAALTLSSLIFMVVLNLKTAKSDPQSAPQESSCICNGLVSEEGGGECQTSYRGKRWCYITAGSNCADAQQSQNYSEQRWSNQACQTNIRNTGNACTCNGLIYEGKGECKTRYKGRFWCYVVASAACSDKIESTKVDDAWSYQACQQDNHEQETTPQVLAPTPVPQQDTTEGRQTYYQVNSDGYIECREDSDCPGERIDPNCTIIEDDGKQNPHCWQIKYDGLVCKENCYTSAKFINGTLTRNESCNGKFCNFVNPGADHVKVTNCYTDPLTNITHINDCWDREYNSGGKCEDCGNCLVGTNMSTSSYIQVTEDNKQNRKKFCEEHHFYSLDNCPENAGCRAPSAGGGPVSHTSSATSQELVLVDRIGCPHEYCKRGNICCKLVLSRRGYYFCPHRC